MSIAKFQKQIIEEIEVELRNEFDRNFERKAFFNKPWARTKLTEDRGSLMVRTGKLRRSISSSSTAKTITFESNMPYARIQNEGGVITVSAKMKRYFWAKFYETKENKWKAMALKPVGSKITIPQRQFIGDHSEVHKVIEKVIDYNFKLFSKQLGNSIQSKFNRK